MAITKTILAKSNFNTEHYFPNAYIRVEWARVQNTNGENKKCEAKISILDAEKSLEIESRLIGFTISSEVNCLKKSYEYLKTLPEFAGATDC
jgi:hypothetical protein